ncbi:MAG: efflux RND transporter periplasmic adaptor subunit [Spirochaetales bacterium]|nr:efflux RND transporter periplasmic adaptor subunit [Spirochaetales bacterium]
MTKTTKLTFTGLVVLSLAISSCGNFPPGRSGSDEAAAGKGPAGTDAPVVEKSYNVRAAMVSEQELSSYIDLSGDVEASVSVDVFPDAAGKLLTLNVKPGSTVRKDQIVGTVDPSRPGMNYAESPVKAPISGTVTAVNADPGSTVAQQMPLITIGKIDRLIITTQVPERFLYMVENGQEAMISTTAAPAEEFSARITGISPIVNPVSRTLEIELTITGRSPVKAGMFVGVRLITSTEENALVIPEKALIRRNNETYVYRVTGDVSEKVLVKLGLESAGLIEIIEGLSEGDQVITEGASLLSDGAKIKVLQDLSILKGSDAPADALASGDSAGNRS